MCVWVKRREGFTVAEVDGLAPALHEKEDANVSRMVAGIEKLSNGDEVLQRFAVFDRLFVLIRVKVKCKK